MVSNLFLAILVLAVIAYLIGSARAKSVRGASRNDFHSRPIYHALNVAIWTAIPAFIVILLWQLFHNNIIDQLVLRDMGEAVNGSSSQRSLILSQIQQLAAGRAFSEVTPELSAAAEHYQALRATSYWAMAAVAMALALSGLAFGYKVIATRFRARHSVERSLTWFMLFCSMVAILTTAGIVASLLYESFQFFARVPFNEFLFGLRWEPQIPLREDQIAGAGAFGVIPVLLGTIVISALAMLVSVPTGLFSAVYLTEYASPRFRALVKPLLEILAGIPTVVYGFFAVLIVSPAIRNLGESIGLSVSPNAAISAGAVMGVMIIPFVSSLSDDALATVPRAMRDGSLAMGATKGETIRKVLLPAALPGIVGGVLLALSRAIGETMIVVMAAGLIASLNINPLDSVTTVTVQIVTLLIGDTAFDNPKTLAAFALGLLLFLITLALNIIALRVVRKYREKY